MRRGVASSPAEALRLVVVLWASVGAIQPLLAPGLPSSHDAEGHLYRLFEFDLVFRAGNFFPRIAPHLAQDYGYATFTFYSPAALYLGEAFRLLGLGYITSLKACFALGIIGAGFGAYLLGRDLYGRLGGILAALVYVYLPYRLLDLYTRGDLSETLAMALLPFVLWSMWRVARRPRIREIVVGGVSLALLIATHNLTAFFAGPVVVCFLLVASTRSLTWQSIRGVSATAGFALALSAFYWVPVAYENGALNLTALTAGFFDYHQHFFAPDQLVQATWTYDYVFSPQAGIVFNLSRVQAVVIAVAAAWLAVTRPASRGILAACVGGIGLLLWLEQSGSVWFWDHVPLMRILQFPYRLSIYVTLLSALVVGSFVARPIRPQVASGKHRLAWVWPQYIGAILGAAALAAIGWAALARIPTGRGVIDESQVNLPTIWRLEQDRQLVAAATQADYLPTWTQGNIFDSTLAWLPTSDTPTVRLSAQQLDPLTFIATIDAAQRSFVRFDKVYYQSWQASLDGNPLALGPTGPLGLIQASIPGGPHTLRLSPDGAPIERAAADISLVALLAVVVLAINPRARGWIWRGAGVVGVVGVVCVLIQPQIRPPQLVASGIDFGDSVRLVGASVNPIPDATGALEVSFAWQPLATPLSDCEIHLRLLGPGPAGTVAARRDKTPVFGLRPCSAWQPNEVIRDEEFIRLPSDQLVGSYELAVDVSIDGHAVAPLSGPTATWEDGGPNAPKIIGLSLESVSVAPATGVAKAYPASPVANLAGAISLDRARIHVQSPSDAFTPAQVDPRFVAEVEPGEHLSIDLDWRSLTDVSEDYSVFNHLVGPDRKVVGQDDAWPDRFNFPTSVWFPGDRRADAYDIAVPPTLAPGIYTVVTGMYDRRDFRQLPLQGAANGQDEIDLGTVKVASPNRVYGEIHGVEPRDDEFGATVALVGTQLNPETPLPGDHLTVTLAWRALALSSINYTEFVHLLGPDGKVKAQHDQLPTNGRYPTSDWDPGDTVYDQIEVPLPKDLPAGRYRLEVGLYRLDTGARLPLSDGQTSRVIATTYVR